MSIQKEEKEKMNKAELIHAAAMKADVSKKDAEAVLTAALDAIAEALAEGESNLFNLTKG